MTLISRHARNLLENSGVLNSLLEGVPLSWRLHSQTELEGISQLKCGHFEPWQDWLPFPRQVVLEPQEGFGGGEKHSVIVFSFRNVKSCSSRGGSLAEGHISTGINFGCKPWVQ